MKWQVDSYFRPHTGDYFFIELTTYFGTFVVNKFVSVHVLGIIFLSKNLTSNQFKFDESFRPRIGDYFLSSLHYKS